MPRPKKNNADYFSHDNDMRNDRKIKTLIHKFGLEGYAIRNMLLECICGSENLRLNIGENEIDLLAGDLYTTREKLESIIEFSLKINLLQKEGDFLFCEKLSLRLQPLFEKRNSMLKRYEKIVSEAETPISEAETKNKIVSEAETPISEAETTQSKVKESKEKKSIIKNNISKEIQQSGKEENVQKIQKDDFAENLEKSAEIILSPPVPPDPPKQNTGGNPDINRILEIISKHNDGLIDGTIKEQRQYGKHLFNKLSKSHAVTNGEYTEFDLLDSLLEIIKQDQYFIHKISGPKKIYYSLVELMNRAKSNFIKKESEQIKMF